VHLLPGKVPFPFNVQNLLTVLMVSQKVLIRPVNRRAQTREVSAVLGDMLVVISPANFA
jgi:hypothetical protein